MTDDAMSLSVRLICNDCYSVSISKNVNMVLNIHKTIRLIRDGYVNL